MRVSFLIYLTVYKYILSKYVLASPDQNHYRMFLIRKEKRKLTVVITFLTSRHDFGHENH